MGVIKGMLGVLAMFLLIWLGDSGPSYWRSAG